MEFQAENHKKTKHSHAAAFPENQLVIRIPDYRVMRIVARFFLLGLVIVVLPSLGSIIGDSPNSSAQIHLGPSDSLDFALLLKFFMDLTNEGLFNPGQKVLFVDDEADKYWNSILINGPLIWGDSEIAVISESDFQLQSSIPYQKFDFVFTSSLSPEFIDRILKTGGIAAVRLSNNPSKAFFNPSNYKIVYIRRFGCTIAAIKKSGPADTSMMSSPAKRRLFGFESEAKKAALDGLEDVLLEPPRSASSKSNKYYLKRTKYLPDLMGDSLYDYPRRVFIDVRLPGNNGRGSIEWFKRNYPTRNRDFKMYKVELVEEESQEVGISDWLRKNVREEEYVVMKAEAEVVEEMMSSKAIGLVDELFLECNHQWQGGKRKYKSRRAYWECLALYGRLRDEGVAVHQWWG